ncbi:hypothetical protein [Nannocystis sp. SCPEA4]|uniref:hypothetical protein n=1 Tax=Nannocystis sp. SCPEA4 TaxID=2996787 RepID=UPI00226DC1AA|nr:hypothetical protein [Nannocystis sp. SCPEA4]MCY1061733.1 hypothetical protein [Nannocystis sp. SCPEA4]
MDVPGLFFFLVRDGLVTSELLAELCERLPPEQYVRSSARDGEGFDSTRWPLARDAALATTLAERFDEPEVARALAEVEAAAGAPPQLRALARRANARVLAACGGEASMFTQWWRDATADDLAVFAEPAWDTRVADIVAALQVAHHEAADGLYAFHVHRGLPGPCAEATARLARRALAEKRVTASELVDAAWQLVIRSEPYFAAEPSPAARGMIAALVAACAEIRRVTGATGCTLMSETFALPSRTAGSDFMILAGPRALLLLKFTALPVWTSRISAFRSRPLFTRFAAAQRFELVLGEHQREEDRAPAAVAALCFFVELSLDAHVAAHPEDEAVFPLIDDAMLDRMFA